MSGGVRATENAPPFPHGRRTADESNLGTDPFARMLGAAKKVSLRLTTAGDAGRPPQAGTPLYPAPARSPGQRWPDRLAPALALARESPRSPRSSFLPGLRRQQRPPL